MPLFDNTRRLLLLAVMALAGFAHADSYPSHPIRLIVTYPPGGTADAVARILAPKLSELLGQSVVIDNRGGAGGMIGGEVAAKSTPDGYTVMLDASNHAQNPALHSHMPFDTLRDFAPVSLLIRVPNVLLVYPPYPVHSVADLIALAKAKPGEVNFASSGVGSAQHLAGELFDAMAHVQMTHVAYKGGGPALTDVMAGRVPVFFASLGSSMPFIRNGKLRPVALAAEKRSPVLLQVPTIAESGLPGYQIYEWNGAFVPRGTPPAIVDKLSRAFAAAVHDPEVRSHLLDLGAEPVGSTPAELERFRRAEIDKWSRVAHDNHIQLD